MPTSRSWVVVAGAARARIFQADTPMAALQELEDLANPEARQRTRELTSDAPGRALDRSGGARHAVGRERSASRQVAVRFAKLVAERLHRACEEGAFERLYLVCAPTFLGLVRNMVSATVSARITATVDKDLTTQSAEAVRAQLPERL